MGVTAGGANMLLGAPLPPPQAANENIPASAKRVSEGRSQAVKRFFDMIGFPDDVVLKAPAGHRHFGRCNKHLADFVQIKA